MAALLQTARNLLIPFDDLVQTLNISQVWSRERHEGGHFYFPKARRDL